MMSLIYACPAATYIIHICLFYSLFLQVKIKELCGKHVVLYFWWLTYDGLDKRYSDLNADLEEIYRAYNPVGAFEVVFVALGKNEDLINSP